MVEYPVHTRYVICSSQIAATRPVGQAVKTPPFHGGNMGSIPVRVTRKKDFTKVKSFFNDVCLRQMMLAVPMMPLALMMSLR